MASKVLVFGTFDYFHPGHAFVLTQALKRGNVTVTVARDETVLKIKGVLPDHTAQQRSAAIKKQFPQVNTVLGSTSNYLASINSVQPDLILLGYDQHLPPGISEADLGVTVERLPAFKAETYKSSLVKQRQIGTANQ